MYENYVKTLKFNFGVERKIKLKTHNTVADSSFKQLQKEWLLREKNEGITKPECS